ncbi:unnamed protein product [Cyclocybe aegerita]|uniref:Uncharacterized protein n=1 Tax=Cyclocybe aegerita TaxID=1973307 RepID=A0A8S0XH82_CYCAE|nr:unnamed protein product [Cyclocybe aegerita]
MNSTADKIINPMTPMAYLSPDLAFQLTIATYVLVGTLGVILWDILNNIRIDLPFLSTYPLNFPTVAYWLSRWSSLAFVTATTIFRSTYVPATVRQCMIASTDCWRHRGGLASPIAIPCQTLSLVTACLFAIAGSSTTLLFLIRVLAIFDGNKPMRIFFRSMWLAVIGGVLTPTIEGLVGENIGPTKYCIKANVPKYVGAAVIIPLINDTLVFLAISWQLMRGAPRKARERTEKIRLWSALRGDYLPSFSRGLLQDGQVYYLTTVTANLIGVFILLLPFVPIVYRSMLAAPNEALMNMMACRVYRRTKLGRSADSVDPSNTFQPSMNEESITVPITFAVSGNGQLSNIDGAGQETDHSLRALEVAEIQPPTDIMTLNDIATSAIEISHKICPGTSNGAAQRCPKSKRDAQFNKSSPPGKRLSSGVQEGNTVRWIIIRPSAGRLLTPMTLAPDEKTHIYSENTEGYVSNRTFIVSGTAGSLLGFKDIERLSMAVLRGQSSHASESRETDERDISGGKRPDVAQG